MTALDEIDVLDPIWAEPGPTCRLCGDVGDDTCPECGPEERHDDQLALAYVGENGIEAGRAYRCEAGRWIEVMR